MMRTLRKNIQNIIQKAKAYRHAVPLLIYAIIYLVWFSRLEETVTGRYRIIHVPLDDVIPFCEVFVVPYIMWFAYVAVVVAYLLLHDKQEYIRTFTFLCTGMTVFLLISTLWPSIHVYNSLGCHIAVMKSQRIKNAKYGTGLRIGSFILCVSIIMSTMFIKQHSAYDVVTAFIMAAVMYGIVYRPDVLLRFRLNPYMRHKRTGSDIHFSS